MKSILGLSTVVIEGAEFEVNIFKAEGVPEAGHLSYAMTIKAAAGDAYAIFWDGYTSNRLFFITGNGVFDSGDSDNEYLELETDLLRAVMEQHGFPQKNVDRFFDCDGFELREGSLIQI